MEDRRGRSSRTAVPGMAQASHHSMAVIARLLGPAESASHQSRCSPGKMRRGGAVSPRDRGRLVARMKWRHAVRAAMQSGGGSAVPEALPAYARRQGRAVGATLVVARFAHGARWLPGDHKGRPYIILTASD